MSDIVEDILFGPEDEMVKPPEESSSQPLPKKTKPVAEEPPSSPTDLLGEISKAIQDILNPISQRLDAIEKRLAQPVQFKTSEPATGSSSAEKLAAGKPTGQDGR